MSNRFEGEGGQHAERASSVFSVAVRLSVNPFAMTPAEERCRILRQSVQARNGIVGRAVGTALPKA